MKKQKPQPLKIGETGITPDGQKVECCKVNDIIDDCMKCYFANDSKHNCNKKSGLFVCMSTFRQTLDEVYFKKVK